MIMSKFPILRRFQGNLQGTIRPPTSRGPRHLTPCSDSSYCFFFTMVGTNYCNHFRRLSEVVIWLQSRPGKDS